LPAFVTVTGTWPEAALGLAGASLNSVSVTRIDLADTEADVAFAPEEDAPEAVELLVLVLPHPESTTTASTKNPLMRSILLCLPVDTI
jgi:hypothetical protein